MQAKHTFVLKYTQELQHPEAGLVETGVTVLFLECEGEVDVAVIENAAKKAWAETKAVVAPHSAFKVKDPQLTCETSYSDVSWE